MKYDIDSAQDLLDSIHPWNPAEGGWILDVTGEKQMFFTLWRSKPSGYARVPGIYNYHQNVAIDFDRAIEFLLKLQAKHPGGIGVCIESDTTSDFHSNKMAGKIMFGKHSGEHIAEVAEVDYSYVLWLAGQNCGSTSIQAREIVNQKLVQEGKRMVSLNIPYADSASREAVKSLGAKWSGEKKTWQLIATEDQIKPFDKFIVEPR